jgi:hypothetical protein
LIDLLRHQEETIEIVLGDAARCKGVITALIANFDELFVVFVVYFGPEIAQDVKQRLDKITQEQAKQKEEKNLELKKQLEQKYSALKKDDQTFFRKEKTKSMQLGALSKLEDQWAKQYIYH